MLSGIERNAIACQMETRISRFYYFATYPRMFMPSRVPIYLEYYMDHKQDDKKNIRSNDKMP